MEISRQGFGVCSSKIGGGVTAPIRVGSSKRDFAWSGLWK